MAVKVLKQFLQEWPQLFFQVLLCEDSGAVSIWTTSDDAWKQWTEELSVAEHDDVILSVDCLESGKKYVTAGADGNVKVNMLPNFKQPYK